jgi:hypothetical protein
MRHLRRVSRPHSATDRRQHDRRSPPQRVLRGDFPDGGPFARTPSPTNSEEPHPRPRSPAQLEAEGLVSFSPHRGAVVSTLSLDEIDELFELRADIEGDLLRRAIPRMTDEQFDRAIEVLDAFEERSLR